MTWHDQYRDEPLGFFIAGEAPRPRDSTLQCNDTSSSWKAYLPGVGPATKAIATTSLPSEPSNSEKRIRCCCHFFPATKGRREGICPRCLVKRSTVYVFPSPRDEKTSSLPADRSAGDHIFSPGV